VRQAASNHVQTARPRTYCSTHGEEDGTKQTAQGRAGRARNRGRLDMPAGGTAIVDEYCRYVSESWSSWSWSELWQVWLIDIIGRVLSLHFCKHAAPLVQSADNHEACASTVCVGRRGSGTIGTRKPTWGSCLCISHLASYSTPRLAPCCCSASSTPDPSTTAI
jgi:hypothetical protein